MKLTTNKPTHGIALCENSGTPSPSDSGEEMLMEMLLLIKVFTEEAETVALTRSLFVFPFSPSFTSAASGLPSPCHFRHRIIKV